MCVGGGALCCGVDVTHTTHHLRPSTAPSKPTNKQTNQNQQPAHERVQMEGIRRGDMQAVSVR
jgi:hypothetical protein